MKIIRIKRDDNLNTRQINKKLKIKYFEAPYVKWNLNTIFIISNTNIYQIREQQVQEEVWHLWIHEIQKVSNYRDYQQKHLYFNSDITALNYVRAMESRLGGLLL